MPQEITAKLGVGWVWEDGDGTACFHCGDAAWLRQLGLRVTINGKRAACLTVACTSCGEIIMKAQDKRW